MQRWILRTTLGISLAVIALMTLAMLWGDWVGTATNAQRRVEAVADRVAAQLHDVRHRTGAVTAADVEEVRPADHAVVVRTPDGSTVAAGDAGVGGPTATEVVDDVGTVTLVDISGTLPRNHLVATVTIVGIGLLLALLTTVVLVRAARRLTAPISDLARRAERLGSGDLRASGRRYGVSELDLLAGALDTAATRMAGLLAEERRLTIDASHQLKTPLTALSLRLQELADRVDDPAARSESAAALEQVERLAEVVDQLMLARRSSDVERPGRPLSEVVEQQVREWRPAFAAVGRDLMLRWALPGPVQVDAGPVGQVVSVLIENSLLHGAGSTGVTVDSSDGGVAVTWVEVEDEGPGISAALAPRIFDREVSGSGSTGLGLAAAQDAAVSIGGRLALVRRRPACFRLYLGWEDPSPVGPEPEERAEPHPDDVAGDVVGKG